MKVLNCSQVMSVSGGEVGATGMGDDYHYTGVDSSNAGVLAECVGGAGGMEGGAFMACAWMIYDYGRRMLEAVSTQP